MIESKGQAFMAFCVATGVAMAGYGTYDHLIARYDVDGGNTVVNRVSLVKGITTVSVGNNGSMVMYKGDRTDDFTVGETVTVSAKAPLYRRLGGFNPPHIGS